MVELVVVDSGRSGTKVVTDEARDCFPSKLGEYHVYVRQHFEESTKAVASLIQNGSDDSGLLRFL